jgi:hypothetical protein
VQDRAQRQEQQLDQEPLQEKEQDGGGEQEPSARRAAHHPRGEEQEQEQEQVVTALHRTAPHYTGGNGGRSSGWTAVTDLRLARGRGQRLESDLRQKVCVCVGSMNLHRTFSLGTKGY